ncbi:MAG: helix-turn-helix domain-containing protein [Cytophagales bacterium]|nr:helix-turn-helix domain-containing protein [Cytophagales bacterium]
MNLLFLFASIGVLNGFIVCMYLILKKNRSLAELYFGGLLLALSIRIGKSILYYFDRETDLLVLQIGLSFCLFIGPLFYLFLKHKLRPTSSAKRSDHFLLIGLVLVIALLGVIYPYRGYPEKWNGAIIHFIYGTWSFFTLVGIGSLLRQWNQIERQSSQSDQFYLLVIVTAYLFITLTYQLALYTGVFYIWGSLIFTVSFYVLLGRILTRKKEILPKVVAQPLTNGEDMMHQVQTTMEAQKLFLNPRLKLDDLATATDLSRHVLSKLLNEVYPNGFSQFIKEYRVQEAKQLIKDHPEWSLEGVGQEAGFSSRSSFFEAFKKVESRTPAQFRKTLMLETSPE